ncbi:unnamed protein product [Paramecium pentaurelia]|uniref:t-SNARE coiled-coil homology domain-containing protein n=1 Tax=Paramecium pentaurelia TaxID=43138 RepID=A0A8S1SG57_9CILI|nr:unnamed protein product [Paramecium pentaurelia]
MTELDEFDSNLNAELDKLQKEIDSLSKKEYNQKNAAIKKCYAQVKSISTLIESYDLEISNLDKAQSAKYNDSLRSINQRFQRLKNELEFKKNEGQNQENLFKGRSEQQPQRLEDMNRQQVIDVGNQVQQNAIVKLNEITKTVQQGNELADQINMELDKQIAQLDRMYDTVMDTQSVLKRSAKYIKYFARQVYTDKLLMCLIGLIFIAIIVLIVLSALGLDDGKFNTPDQVKGSLASDSSSTTNSTTTTGSG